MIPTIKGTNAVPFICLFTELTARTLVQLATEALLYQVVQTVAQWFQLHLVDDLIDKGVLQQQFRLIERDTTLTHIEQGGIVQLSDGRTVGTLHVVSIDFQHRLGKHTGLLRRRQVLVGHLRRRLLSTVFYEYTTRKGSYGFLVEHVLVQLVRGAVGHLMH